MATQTIRYPRRVGSLLNATEPLRRGGPEMKTYFKEAATQTYVAGDFVYLDSNGKVAICTVDGSSRLSSAIAGIASKKATGVTDSDVMIEALRGDDIVEMNIYHSTLGSAITNINQVGKVYGIKKVSGKWVVDLENGEAVGEASTLSLIRVQVVSLSPFDAVGDTYGRVWVRFPELSISSTGTIARTRIRQLA